MTKNIETPMLDKMVEVQEKSQLCGEFLEYLQNKYSIFNRLDSVKEPIYHGFGDSINIENVLADFFEIDLLQADKERNALLQSLN